ncbi:MAG: Tfp pilus assembly protein PilP [Nitrospinales bacterium]|jgi:Tfp pilus assembly protein PilP
MKEIKKTYFLVLFLTCVSVSYLLSGQALAKTGAMPAGIKVQNKTLGKLFWLSGLNNRYLDVESALEQQENIDPQALKANQTGFAKNLLRHGDGANHIRINIKKAFRKRFSQEHTEASMRWFNSRIGRKILKADSEAISPENGKEREKFAKGIMNAPPSESRLLVVERIESAGTLSPNIKSLYLAYVEAMFPFNNLLQGKRLVKVVGMLKDEVIEPIREQVLHQKLFAYRNISIKNLKSYASFLESSAGRWFVLSELQGFTQGIKKALVDVHKVQRELLIEIDEGGPEFPLLRELAPPGQRYLLVQLRDPFKPLFTDDGPVEKPKSPLLPSARQFGNELESIPSIALYVMRKIETKRPELFRKMKHYERLFNSKEELEAMSDDEYADAVETYRTILENAGETKVPISSLQLEYATLRLTGVISKNSKTLALIETSDSKGHAVGKGDIIGPKFGFVDEIQPERIIVIEKSRDYLGNILTRQKTIEFSQKI